MSKGLTEAIQNEAKNCRYCVSEKSKKSRAHSICQNLPAGLVISQKDFTDLKDKFHPSPSKFAKFGARPKERTATKTVLRVVGVVQLCQPTF